MPSLRQRARWAPVWILAAALPLGCASTPAGGDWQVVEGPAIAVYTDGSVESATALYGELERFRGATAWFTNLEKANVGKVRVMAFKSGTDALPYLVEKDVGAWASMSVDGNLAATKLESKTKLADRQALKRDLVKVWMDYAGVRAPLWYREGLAELISAFDVQEKTVTTGGLPPVELSTYAELIADEKKGHAPGELLSETPARYTLEDRARVWLAVHYLMVANTERQTALREYFRAWSKGTPSADAFHTAFGQTPADFYRLEVARYGTRALAARQYNVDGAVPEPKVREATTEEIEKLTAEVDRAVQRLR
ncbi:MAG TPA: hypothetical protein VII78_15605 [Myxococcota bacterium]|jgi:hypothetical protein